MKNGGPARLQQVCNAIQTGKPTLPNVHPCHAGGRVSLTGLNWALGSGTTVPELCLVASQQAGQVTLLTTTEEECDPCKFHAVPKPAAVDQRERDRLCGGGSVVFGLNASQTKISTTVSMSCWNHANTSQRVSGVPCGKPCAVPHHFHNGTSLAYPGFEK
jgi:hypothetical protein